MTLQTRYSLFVLASAVMAAGSNVLTEVALRFFKTTPFLIALLSNFVGGMLLMSLAAKRQSMTQTQQDRPRQDWARVLVAALSIYVVGFLMRFESIGLIGAGKSVLLGRLETFFVVILAMLFLSERVTPRHGVAGILAVGGTLLINFDPQVWQLQFGWGEFLAVLSSLGIAAGIIIIKPVLDRWSGGWTTGVALTLGALFLVPLFPFYANYANPTAVGWGAILLIISMGILRGAAWSTYNVAMRHIGASRSAIIFVTSAFFAVILQVILNGLAPQLGLQVPANLFTALTGGVIIALGIIILQRKPKLERN